MRIPVVMGHEAEDEGQLIDFLAQPPLWSDAGIGWGSSLERLFNFIGTNTRREVTPNDERQRYSEIVVQSAAECLLWIANGRSADREWSCCIASGGNRPPSAGRLAIGDS